MLDEILYVRCLTDSGTFVFSKGQLHIPGRELSCLGIYMYDICVLYTVVYAMQVPQQIFGGQISFALWCKESEKQQQQRPGSAPQYFQCHFIPEFPVLPPSLYRSAVQGKDIYIFLICLGNQEIDLGQESQRREGWNGQWLGPNSGLGGKLF